MDSCNRSSIYPGQLVSIVLKADQGTGRRTVGEVADILSPGSFHPRGIKVRLKDGRVGRVQEILPDPGASISEVPELLVLVIQRPDMSFYTRKLHLDSGDEITALGLDKLLAKRSQIKNTVDLLFEKVRNRIDKPEFLFNEIIEMNEQKVDLSVYICRGVDVKDDNRSDWDWTGWSSISELEELSMKMSLSPESMLIVDKILLSTEAEAEAEEF